MEMQATLQQNMSGSVSNNFPPTFWGHTFASFSFSDSEYESYTMKVELLKEKVKDMLMASTKNPIQNIHFINILCRLGVSYHFEMDIEEQLNHIFHALSEYLDDNDCDIYDITILFQVLRHHGYKMSCDWFQKFKDTDGKFKKDMSNDIKGILSLYEASFLSVHGEDILDEALAFTRPILESSVDMKSTPHHLAEHVKNALILPFHKSVPRIEARKYISFYEQEESPNQILLEFAKLDFNRVQLVHKKELSELARWWKEFDLAGRFPYARDRIVEIYYWACSIQFKPHFALLRLMAAKYLALISLVDDTYDAYAPLEDANAFTHAFNSGDMGAIDQLPHYMKDLYKALMDLFEETNNYTSKEGRSYCVNYIKEEFKELLSAYRMEAQWYNDAYVPTFSEYMPNAIVSGCYGVLVAACFVGMGKLAGTKEYEWLKANPKIVNGVETMARLVNDTVSDEEQKRGDCASAVECYQKEYKVTREKAIEDIFKICGNAWKDINEDCLEPASIARPILEFILNLGRVSEVVYKFDDAYTDPLSIKDQVISLYLQPFTI